MNDLVEINFELLNLASCSSSRRYTTCQVVRSGGLVEGTAGRHVAEWNGRNRRGQLVAPGVYVLLLHVEADRGTNTDRRSCLLSTKELMIDEVHVLSISMFITLAWYEGFVSDYISDRRRRSALNIAEEYEFVQLSWGDIAAAACILSF